MSARMAPGEAFAHGQAALGPVHALRPPAGRAVGVTIAVPPAGYAVDYTRIRLGEREAGFRATEAALQGWEQFVDSTVPTLISLLDTLEDGQDVTAPRGCREPGGPPLACWRQ